MTTTSATVTRHPAPSGNRDADYFQPTCSACGYAGALYSNRTVEGRRLAARDAEAHRCKPATNPLRDLNASRFPALYGETVTELHTLTCHREGHATHNVDGVDSGVCPRCGDVKPAGVDVVHNPAADAYVAAVVAALTAGKLATSDLRHDCPECGETPALDAKGTGNPHRLVGSFVVVGCEGYYVVNPNLVGIACPSWEPAS